MKAATVHRNTHSVRYPVRHRYPNAADRSYHFHRILDGLLAVATAVGAVTALVFLILL